MEKGRGRWKMLLFIQEAREVDQFWLHNLNKINNRLIIYLKKILPSAEFGLVGGQLRGIQLFSQRLQFVTVRQTVQQITYTYITYT